MLDDWAIELGIDPNSPFQQRANHLVQQDNMLMRQLREIRVARGMSVEMVAELWGVDAETVRHMERYDTDPTLSQLRRYAHAIGAIVSHEVVADPNGAGPA